MAKKITLISIFSLITIALLGAVFCANSTNVEPPALQPISVQPHADWTEHFTNIDAFAEAADLIIMGKVVDSIPELRVDMIFTNQVIKITHLYKGTLSEGDTLRVLQTGGTLDGITTPAFAEAPLLQSGEELILFLRHTSEGHYLVLGGYQGVGEVVNGSIQFVNEDDEIAQELSDMNIAALNDLMALKIEETAAS